MVTQCTMQVQRNTVAERKKANLQLESQLLPVIQPTVGGIKPEEILTFYAYFLLNHIKAYQKLLQKLKCHQSILKNEQDMCGLFIFMTC